MAEAIAPLALVHIPRQPVAIAHSSQVVDPSACLRGGETHLDFAPEGLTVTITLPLSLDVETPVTERAA